MVPGLNNNFKHKGLVFHIQTEDTGEKGYFIVTHLYYGGTIIASKKICYADARSCTELTSLVKELIETQHKKMLLELSQGLYDNKIKALTNANI